MRNSNELNAMNLKAALWDTLQKVKSGKMTPGAGDAVAAQAREILRTVRTQLTVFAQSGNGVSEEIVEFAKPGAKTALRSVRGGPRSRDAVR